MRRLLPLFMILLLTLRGLLGDAMAMGSLPNAGDHMPMAAVAETQTVPQAHHHAQTTADGAHAHTAAASAAVPHCTAAPTAPECGGSHHTTPCAACGICHSVFSSPMLLAPSQGLPTQAAPASGRADFASATLVQATKPPIA